MDSASVDSDPGAVTLRRVLGTLAVLLGLGLLRASLANVASFFTTATLSVEISGHVHLDDGLVLVYGPDPGVYYDGAWFALALTTLLGLGLMVTPLALRYSGRVRSVVRRPAPSDADAGED